MSGECHFKPLIYFNPVQVNTAETDITRMSSRYADNELELFQKTVSSLKGINSCSHFLCVFFLKLFLVFFYFVKHIDGKKLDRRPPFYPVDSV